MDYAVIIERIVPSGKHRWFNLVYCKTAEEAKKAADRLKADNPDCNYGIALSDRNADYDGYVSSRIEKMYYAIADKRHYYDIDNQPFAAYGIGKLAEAAFESKYWKLDAPCSFITKTHILAPDVTDEFGNLMLWAWDCNQNKAIPTPVCFFRYEYDRFRMFWTDALCDEEGWFEVHCNRFNLPGIFEPDVDMFVAHCRENNIELPKPGELQIWYSPRKGVKIGTREFSVIYD